MTAMTTEEALRRLTVLCARREHSAGEIRKKMTLWGISGDQQAAVVDRLVRERFVDDERFARAYVNDKTRYDRWGRLKIERGLLSKRVSGDIIRRVLDAVGEERWTDMLRPLLDAKRRSIKGGDEYTVRGRLIRYAISRGFTADEAYRCLNSDV